MEFALNSTQQDVRQAVARICARFPAEYWRARDEDGVFPHAFHLSLIHISEPTRP